MEVFVLLRDPIGSMRSRLEPFGRAVLLEEEAERWVAACAGKMGDYHRGYEKLTIIEIDIDGEIEKE